MRDGNTIEEEEGIFKKLKMPGLPKQNAQFRDISGSPRSSRKVSRNGIWSKHRNEITFDRLQKFWNELPTEARKQLMRVDKQTLFEQARKNLYCSRCNGLLLEGFSHIVMYGKSLQQNGGVALHITTSRPGPSKNGSDDRTNTMHLSCRDDDIQDPSVHPWGGLVACRDGILTVLDCFLDEKSLKALHNVFDSARMRERERKLLYPDACGGGGRGWISQGMANYGRGHGTREACALHTARLPCETLVGFWSALGDETQQSLLRMKEEDFMERLMFREEIRKFMNGIILPIYKQVSGIVLHGRISYLFESKRFCRDCRRNVIREFKELKELKRMRRETRCTKWFCVADVTFEYEVSESTIQVDWHQSFADTIKILHHFEWAVGTGEGKSDIMEFKDVGLHGSVHANDLDLSGLTECFITLRAWKLDGRCNDFSVKAHALKGQPCVHRRLLVGGGFVTITKGECISRFFEQAEEAEEEEDDDSMDKDGNEVDGEGSRLQKHAKSPELAREFLLDAATVIFKEQVEKAFREGTARQNAHSVFVCLALKLLEERLHVACKEISTLEKQIKLLEEEEKEKREEEERKERRKTKDREKKLRRKEKLRGKDKEREEKCVDSKQNSFVPEMTEEITADAEKESSNCNNSEDLISEPGDIVLDKPLSSDTQDEPSSGGCVVSKLGTVKDDSVEHSCQVADRKLSVKNVNGTFMIDQSKSSNWKLRFRNEHQLDPASKLCSRNRSVVDDESGDLGDESEPRFHSGYMETPSRCNNSVNRQPRSNPLKSNTRIGGPKYGEKFYSSNYRVRDRFDVKSCGCSLQNDYKTKDDPHVPHIVSGREIKTKFESSSDMSRPLYRKSKYSQGSFLPDSCRIPKSRQVWEPVESGKKYPRSNSDSDITTSSSTFKVDGCEEGKNSGSGCPQPDSLTKSSGDPCLHGISKSSNCSSGSNYYHSHEDNNGEESRNSSVVTNNGCHKGLTAGAKNNSDPTLGNTSNLDNCSPCLSEGDNSVVCSGSQNADSISTSDSEDASQKSEGRATFKCGQNESRNCSNDGVDEKHKTDEGKFFPSRATGRPEQGSFPGDPATTNSHNPDKNRITVSPSSQSHCLLPSLHNPPMPYPVFPAPSTMAYYHQRPTSWSATPANGLISFPQPNCYLFTSPIGYGLPENPSSHFCMQYSGIQPFANPVLDMSQLPTYQMVNKANGMNYEEQTRNSKLGGAKDSINIPDTGLSDRHAEKPAANCQEQSPHGDFAASGKDGKNFSLFHFGGPVAVSTGCGNINEVSRKEGIVGDTFSNSPTIPSRADFACTGKETTGEEYSLFAASNGIRFPFF